MACSQGHLACKECFLEHILTQKKEYARNLQLWEQSNQDKQNEQLKEDDKKRQEEIEAFEKTQRSVGNNAEQSKAPKSEKKEEGSFWIASKGPEGVKAEIGKPDATITCVKGGHHVT